jgi:hypothetical protein
MGENGGKLAEISGSHKIQIEKIADGPVRVSLCAEALFLRAQ